MKRVKAKIIIGLLTLMAALGLSNAASAADGNYYTVEINNGVDLVSEVPMRDQTIFTHLVNPNWSNGIKYGDQIIAMLDNQTGKIIIDEDFTVDVPTEQIPTNVFNHSDVKLSPDDYDGIRLVMKKEPKQQSSDGSHHVINLYNKSFAGELSYLDEMIISGLLGFFHNEGYLDGRFLANHDGLVSCPSDSSNAFCAPNGKPLLVLAPNGRYGADISIPDGVTADDNIHDVLTQDAKAVIISVIMSTAQTPSSYLNNLKNITINFVEPPHEEQNNEVPAAETVSVPLPATFDDVLAYVITFAGSVSALAILVLVRKKKTSKI